MIGAGYRFMGVDEKVGSADEREDGRGSIHLSDALATGPVGKREAGRGKKKGRGGGVVGEEEEW